MGAAVREEAMPPTPVRVLIGAFSLVIFVLNTLFWCAFLFPATGLKLLVPVAPWRRFWTRVLMAIGSVWIDGNSLGLRLTQRHVWDVRGLEGLSEKGWYLVGSNHRSVMDIAVLQRVFNHRIPFLKFFLKQELIKVPLLGQAWWALDFPFMKRFSREQLAANPDLRGADLETTRRACERFRLTPISIINFLEGTRFSEAKRDRQQSPYRHLLLPKAGGLAFVLSALGGSITEFVDVTILYPDGTPTFWDVLSRGLKRIVVRIRHFPIPSDLLSGDYLGDAAFRERFQGWVRELWDRKDAEIEALLAA
jgi:1-acyl-sn-glycerol-3-phosphate acyltransferase